MKRLMSSVLALSLLGSSVAMAQPFRGGHDRQGYNGYNGYSSQSRQGYNRGQNYGYRNRDNSAAAVGLGLFALGLFATLATQNQRDRYYDPRGAYGPPAGYGGYGYDYGPGYGGYYGR